MIYPIEHGPASPGDGILSPPGITIGTSRLMSTSAPRYFEGPWYEKYLLLEQYKKEHGNCIVPHLFVYDDVKLGHWVHEQRKSYKKGTLSTNRREMLDALGFSWDPKGDMWERNFALLEQFKAREGHCNAPQSHKEDGASLGSWLSNQRTAMKQGRLDESYQGRLERLGVTWDQFADQWERNFALLEQFKDREGHCVVTQSHEEDGVKLGAWLGHQRKGKRGYNLSSERVERLEGLGVSWDPLEDQWERNFALLEQYKEREGHCNVPRNHEEGGANLGKWLHRQRQDRRGKGGGKLSSERIKRLDKLGVIWELFDKALGISWDPWHDQWERNFALLEQFKEREGHCNVPHLHEEDGINLGRWLSRLRQIRKGNRDGNLSCERIERLESLGMIWESLEDQWERNFALLEQFNEREGHCNVPQRHEESGIKLGIWLNTLRQVRKGNKDGNLSPEQIGRLENIGVVWDPLEDQWERNFALLERFKEREGHCNVPFSHEENGNKLGTWLDTLRQVRKGNKGCSLSSERIERLDEIGIRW